MLALPLSLPFQTIRLLLVLFLVPISRPTPTEPPQPSAFLLHMTSTPLHGAHRVRGEVPSANQAFVGFPLDVFGSPLRVVRRSEGEVDEDLEDLL